MIQKLSGSKLYFSPIILSLAYLLGFDPFGYQLLGLLSVSVLFYFALKLDERKVALFFFVVVVRHSRPPRPKAEAAAMRTPHRRGVTFALGFFK